MLLSNFNLLAAAPGGVARLRELILTLAVQGKLVPQDPGDEPASVLLKKIWAEKDRLINEGKIKRDKPLAAITDEEKPFELPVGWEWSTLVAIGIINPRNNAADDVSASFVQMSSIPVAFSDPHITEPRAWRDIKSGFTQFAEGDVGVAKITPCFENGKSTVFQNLSNGIGAGTTELHIVRPLCEVAPRYVLLFLKTPNFLVEGEAMMTGSAGQKRMPRSYFESKPFPLPPLAEQSRIVTRVEELMRVCDALEVKGKLEAAQHAQLVSTLLGTLTDSDTPKVLAQNWQRIAAHFDLLLDRPQAIDAFEQTILQLAVRGLLVPQDPSDEPASVLLQKIRAEKDRLIAEGKIKRNKPLAAIADEAKPFEMPIGWEWARLQEAYDVRDGTHDTPKYQSSGFPLVTSKNIYGGVLDLSDVKLISPADHQQISARSKVDRNDILFAMIGSIGNPVLVDTDIEFSVKNVALFKYYAVILSCPQYLLLVLQTEVAGMKLRAAGGVQSFVSLGQLRSTMIPLPPLAEQSRIVAHVEELRRLCADLRQRLSASQTTQAHLAEALVESAAG